MAQRVAIAMALARGSRFLFADEPTTGLDPTVAAQVADRVQGLAREGLGLLFITHDLRLAERIADQLLIIDGGEIVDRLSPRALGLARSPAAGRLRAAAARLEAGR
jgi:ABC-type dipeptide/oligopeptide/nickel transport system ATPase component